MIFQQNYGKPQILFFNNKSEFCQKNEQNYNERKQIQHATVIELLTFMIIKLHEIPKPEKLELFEK